MNELAGKVALVTGAARGIGAGIARLFCEEGAAVLLTDILDSGAETAATLREDGYRAEFLKLDVREDADWASAIQTANDHFGGLDILVNNAGVWGTGDIETMDFAELQRVYDVNFYGAFRGIRHALPEMRKREGSSIINIASLSSELTQANTLPYALSKNMITKLTKSAALHCTQKGDAIRINSIHPGPVDTQMMVEVNMPGMIEAIPMKRMGQPQDVAQVALFLASDRSTWITGAEIFPDGGMKAGIS
jgi:NAD(P)-dependent dehydrogenase (short-subunit alcohol dehydrogenase family)